MNKHSRTLVVHILVDAVPTVDVSIRGPSTISAVASLERIKDVIIRSRQAMAELGRGCRCDSVTNSAAT